MTGNQEINVTKVPVEEGADASSETVKLLQRHRLM